MIKGHYHVVLRQADICEEALVMAQRAELVGDLRHIHQQVRQRKVAEDAQQDLVGQIRHPHRCGRHCVPVANSLRRIDITDITKMCF